MNLLSLNLRFFKIGKNARFRVQSHCLHHKQEEGKQLLILGAGYAARTSLVVLVQYVLENSFLNVPASLS
jgi:hypothetical protein